MSKVKKQQFMPYTAISPFPENRVQISQPQLRSLTSPSVLPRPSSPTESGSAVISFRSHLIFFRSTLSSHTHYEQGQTGFLQPFFFNPLYISKKKPFPRDVSHRSTDNPAIKHKNSFLSEICLPLMNFLSPFFPWK